MKASRIFWITTAAMILTVSVSVLFVKSNQSNDPVKQTYRKTSALESRAKKRFNEARSLAPCGYDERLWLTAAERKLAVAGQSSQHAIVLIAPTFSDIYLLTFGIAGIERYTFPGQTAFGPEFTENDHVKPARLPQISLPHEIHERLLAAVSRNTEYAMSSRESGHDGVVYYFKRGSECAMAWSPTEGTVGGYLTELVDSLSEDHPSIPTIERTLDSLERLELAL